MCHHNNPSITQLILINCLHILSHYPKPPKKKKRKRGYNTSLQYAREQRDPKFYGHTDIARGM